MMTTYNPFHICIFRYVYVYIKIYMHVICVYLIVLYMRVYIYYISPIAFCFRRFQGQAYVLFIQDFSTSCTRWCGDKKKAFLSLKIGKRLSYLMYIKMCSQLLVYIEYTCIQHIF